jgi:hypothetical protein
MKRLPRHPGSLGAAASKVGLLQAFGLRGECVLVKVCARLEVDELHAGLAALPAEGVAKPSTQALGLPAVPATKEAIPHRHEGRER